MWLRGGTASKQLLQNSRITFTRPTQGGDEVIGRTYSQIHDCSEFSAYNLSILCSIA